MQTELFDKEKISETQQEIAETQIIEKQKISDYDTREYPVEVLVNKFTEGLEEDEAEIYIPDYQREMVWHDNQKSRFIESILLNLPIPYLFFADDKDGRSEVVDGSQRLRTLVEYCQGGFALKSLKLLNELNDFCFSDLPRSRQRRFNKKTIRIIELTRDMDEEARRQMFDRINSGGTNLKPMEQRIGSKEGSFSRFIQNLAVNKDFRRLCPLSDAKLKRREDQELILRFFAYSDRYEEFDHRVDDFLNQYLDDMNETGFDEKEYEDRFLSMLRFIDAYYPLGFRKSQNDKSVPRIRFEAISVGSCLALQSNPVLKAEPVEQWISSKEFIYLTRSHGSNSRVKVINRIQFVRDMLLGKDVKYASSVENTFSGQLAFD